MRSLCAILVIGAAVALLPVAPIYAKWPEQQRREFNGSCSKTCQSGVAGRFGTCDDYCWCMVSEAEKAYPDPQVFTQLRQANDPVYMRRIKSLEQTCATR